MNIIQTLHLGSGIDPFTDRVGWVAPEYHLMSWALSCLQLRKLYLRVELYANSAAVELLIDTLQLPYDKVHRSHDLLELADPRLWALPKIHTYSLQRSPFLHVDGDVFLFNKFNAALLGGQLIAQNIEEATEYYLSTQQELLTHFSYFPACVKKDFSTATPIRAVNAGILGGSNLEFFEEYTWTAKNYIERNVRHFNQVNLDRFNVFFEQHLFYSLAQERRLPISCLFTDIINDNEYMHLGDFQEVPHTSNYLHLLGQFKKDTFTCVQMAMKLRELYPEYYYRIAALFQQKKLPFFIDYGLGRLSQTEDFADLHARAHHRFQTAAAQPGLGPVPVLKPDLSAYTSTAEALINQVPDESLKAGLAIDYQRFVQELMSFTRHNGSVDFDFLYGRDLAAVGWHHHLFAPLANASAQTIVRCPEAAVLGSEYDWARLMNTRIRAGIPYYEHFDLSPGRYFNLVVPEVHQNHLSIFDIDELEKTILDLVANPITIKRLLEVMRSHADEEVLEHHQDIFDHFVLTMVKQLVIKKAIMPHQAAVETALV